MNNDQFYVCTHCRQWIRISSPAAPNACPHCQGRLEHVPVTASEFSGWDEATRKAMAESYASPVQQPAAEQPVSQQASAQQPAAKKGRSCGGTILVSLVYVLISLGVFYLVTNAGNWIHQNDFLQRSASISLNDAVDNGQDLPVGEFVSLDARWVLGPIATETSTSSWGDSDLTATTGVDYFYYCVLEDYTIIAIQTSNSKEVETLDRISNWLTDVYGYPMDGETVHLQGKLKKMTSSELTGIYNEYLTIFELEPNDPSVHYLILDTTAGRIGSVAVIGGAVALIVIIVLIRRNSAKKKAASKAA